MTVLTVLGDCGRRATDKPRNMIYKQSLLRRQGIPARGPLHEEYEMKKGFVAGCVLSAFIGSSAMAADLAARPVYKAAPPVDVGYDWSGLYLGGHIGYGWGNTDVTDHTVFGFFIPQQKFDTNGFLGGVQGGWNYQFGHFVLGSEVDFSWSDVKGDQTDAVLGGLASVDRSSKAKWMGTATTRLGYAWDRVLVYSKIGAAWAHFDYNDNFSIAGIGSIYNSSASETRSGWTVGTGIEWAFAGNWSAKLEYDYMDFGRRTVDFAPVGGFIPVGLDVDQRISVVKAGINYRFGGMGPVVAKY
jgi:outer membrane immunogenic protein